MTALALNLSRGIQRLDKALLAIAVLLLALLLFDPALAAASFGFMFQSLL